MKRLSRVFLDSDPYNAAKHGLIVPAGRSAVEVSVDDRAFMEKSGPTIDFLSLRPQDDHREWKKVTRWFNPDHLIGITIASCHLIHLMWLVGRRRYLTEEVELRWLFDRPTLAEIEGEDGPDFQEIAFGWGLVEP